MLSLRATKRRHLPITLDDMEKIRPEYKKVEVFAEFCPKCKEQLKGNNSYAFPWECSCGVWHHEWTDPIGWYSVIPCNKKKTLTNN